MSEHKQDDHEVETPLDIAELRRLYQSSGTENWTVMGNTLTFEGPLDGRTAYWVAFPGDAVKAQFIATLHNTLPSLLSRLDALELHLAAITDPATILLPADHPNGQTPAMRALRQAVTEWDMAAKRAARLLESNTELSLALAAAQEREQRLWRAITAIHTAMFAPGMDGIAGVVLPLVAEYHAALSDRTP